MNFDGNFRKFKRELNTYGIRLYGSQSRAFMGKRVKEAKPIIQQLYNNNCPFALDA